MIATGECFVQFVASRTGFRFRPTDAGMGCVRGGQIIAGIVFANWNGDDIELSVAADDLPRRLLRAAGWYAFARLKCARVTFKTAPDNARAIEAMPRLGGRLEGRQRRFYGDKDALVFGILREDYPYGR